jgi:hypothetical protein
VSFSDAPVSCPGQEENWELPPHVCQFLGVVPPVMSLRACVFTGRGVSILLMGLSHCNSSHCSGQGATVGILPPAALCVSVPVTRSRTREIATEWLSDGPEMAPWPSPPDSD